MCFAAQNQPVEAYVLVAPRPKKRRKKEKKPYDHPPHDHDHYTIYRGLSNIS